jgi:translation elongation factor P/translation initiation factor 5A
LTRIRCYKQAATYKTSFVQGEPWPISEIHKVKKGKGNQAISIRSTIIDEIVDTTKQMKQQSKRAHTRPSAIAWRNNP